MKYLTILLFSFCMVAHSQTTFTTRSKSAISYYQKGKEALDYYKYDVAIKYLEKAIEVDTLFVEAYLLLGEAYFELKEPLKYLEMYDKGTRIKADFYPQGLLNLGYDYMVIGYFQKASDAFGRFLDLKNTSPTQQKEAENGLEHARIALQLINNPVPYNPINLGDSINTPYDEYWPNLTADESVIIYTVKLPVNPENSIQYGNQQEDFYSSRKSDSSWLKGTNLGYPLNSPDNEGAHTLSTDGKSMFFTACNRLDGYGLCDIYYTQKHGDNWQLPINLGASINSRYSDKQPSLSSDGKTLYFASNRPGGHGNLDIWYSVLDENNNWGPPVNMGDKINTTGNEQSPFIHPDNQTLYFSSDGRFGLGRSDIYYTRRNPDGSWNEPVNIGYPINSIEDEIGFFVTAKGANAYFSSNRHSNNLDIYKIDLYKEARPSEVSYLKGKVYDAITIKPLEAHFELIDLSSGTIINQANSDPANGEFLICIPSNKNYALNVNRQGYLFYSDNFSLKGIFDNINPFVKNIPLNPINPGEKTILKNIFFPTDSYQLLPESLIELDKLVGFLKINPTVKIEIGGHTDNTGTEEYNNQLSNNRAKSVYDYLISHQINSERVQYKGYGETKPIASNNTEEGKALNRRTEFIIISK